MATPACTRAAPGPCAPLLGAPARDDDGPAEIVVSEPPCDPSARTLDVALSSVAPQDELANGMERRKSSPVSASERLPCSDKDMAQNDLEHHTYEEKPACDAGAAESAVEAILVATAPTPEPTPASSSSPPRAAKARPRGKPRLMGGKKKRASAASKKQLAGAVAIAPASQPLALFRGLADAIGVTKDPGSPDAMLLVIDTADKKMAGVLVPDAVVGASYVPKKFDRKAGQREPNNRDYRTWSWKKFISGSKVKYNPKWGPKPDKNGKVYLKAILQAFERAGIFPVSAKTGQDMRWSKIKKLPASEPWVFHLVKTPCNAKAFDAYHASLYAPQPVGLSGQPAATPRDEPLAYDELPLVDSAEEECLQSLEGDTDQGVGMEVEASYSYWGGSRVVEEGAKMQASTDIGRAKAEHDDEAPNSQDSFWDDSVLSEANDYTGMLHI